MSADTILSLTCPKCGSEDTQRVSIIFQSGTVQIQTQTKGGALAVNDEGFTPVVGGASTSGVQQSQLAQTCAPPEKRDEFGLFAMIVLIVLSPIAGIIAFIIAGVAIKSDWGVLVATLAFLFVTGVVILKAVVAFVQGRGSEKWNVEEWPRLHAEWERSCLCKRCGERFLLS